MGGLRDAAVVVLIALGFFVGGAVPCRGQDVGLDTPGQSAPSEAAEARKAETQKAEAEKAERPREGFEPTVVRLGLFLLDVDSIDSAQQTFNAGVYVEARWNDPRLAHDERSIQKRLDDIWHPRLQILNQQRMWKTFPETVEVRGDGEVIYRQRFWGSFSQPLKLRPFPFDRQVLSTDILAVGYGTDEIRIVDLVREDGGASGIAPAFSLPDWDVVKWETESGTVTVVPGGRPIPALRFRIEVARQAGYYTVKVILPLCLIVAMSWVSFWIDPGEIGVNVSVAITSVLTIVAYCFAIGESLPKLSYLTRMDTFILGSMLMVFLTVGQVVFNSALVKRDRKRIARILDRTARVAYPLMFASMTFWTLFRA